ncbi:putative maltose O-acetyltransferase [Limosilactobacillus coleohominis 101-4-CHN]|uniref:Putative maltose O-acetyltransferase n=1 Tax=Limosilactobacillus coleohominis 101-4-CHN TaxID=575594 RepID=C7XTW6_9LACO|nr:DapH/DapD/GlmU-related protein [Limosilactobacillus coleohominis]EEU30727.1 putative maltose O-acetyltransferase [Limosilactobacillus coleohominis 101-4-CHN]
MEKANIEQIKEITKTALKTQDILQKLNSSAATQEEIREVIGKITGHKIDDSVEIRLPIRSDYGANLKIGKGVFINSGVMFTDLGGIELADNVLVGPNATIISVNHPLDPQKRHTVEMKPVYIDKNAWLGANSTILPGVTVGQNAVVAAGAVVTKDVPANTVVAGVPAKVIKRI